jgi:hypothetical protein
MGHSKISVTLDIYSHVLPGLQEAAAERFDKMLEGKVKNEANAEGKIESVSKPLAENGDLNGGADGIRTHYLPDTNRDALPCNNFNIWKVDLKSGGADGIRTHYLPDTNRGGLPVS